MSRVSRLVVLVTSVAAVVGAMAGTAGAVTWHVSGTGSFTATASPATLSSTGANFVCAASSATGTYTAGSFVGTVYSGLSGSITYSGCSLAGQSVEMTCGLRFTGQTQPVATVVTGNADLTCGVTLAANGLKLCHVEGSPHAVYTDNAAAADTLTLTTSQLRVTGPSCLFGSNDTAHLSHFTYTFVNAGPHIVRTA